MYVLRQLKSSTASKYLGISCKLCLFFFCTNIYQIQNCQHANFNKLPERVLFLTVNYRLFKKLFSKK